MKEVQNNQVDNSARRDRRKFLLTGTAIATTSLLPRLAIAKQTSQSNGPTRVNDALRRAEPQQKESEEDKKTQQIIISLSRQKWDWMADKNVAPLADLFDDASVFVHMGGTWGKEHELRVIGSGDIHYKKADIHDVSVNIIRGTAILLNRITLLAVVGGNEVTNNFMVTEVYVEKEDGWKIGSLSFTKLTY